MVAVFFTPASLKTVKPRAVAFIILAFAQTAATEPWNLKSTTDTEIHLVPGNLMLIRFAVSVAAIAAASAITVLVTDKRLDAMGRRLDAKSQTMAPTWALLPLVPSCLGAAAAGFLRLGVAPPCSSSPFSFFTSSELLRCWAGTISSMALGSGSSLDQRLGGWTPLGGAAPPAVAAGLSGR